MVAGSPRARAIQCRMGRHGLVLVYLVNAAHVKQVPGRKTDKADARWLAKLMRYGLLAASFIPPQGQRDLRDLRRYRTQLVQERSREVNRVQGVLGRANMKLAAVATGHHGRVGEGHLGGIDRGSSGPWHDGRVGQRPDADEDPTVGTGADRADARPPPAAVDAAVGTSRLLG